MTLSENGESPDATAIAPSSEVTSSIEYNSEKQSAVQRVCFVVATSSPLNGRTTTRFEGTFEEVVDQLGLAAPAEHASKQSCPLLQFAELGDTRSKGKSLRNAVNVVRLHAVVGDYDAGEVSMDEARRKLQACGIKAALYTTPSHKAAAPRWRVIAPLSAPVRPEAYKARAEWLNGALDGVLAPESGDYSRGFYYGRVAGVAYEFSYTSGQLLIDDTEALDVVVEPMPFCERVIGERKERPRQVMDAHDYKHRVVTLERVNDKTVAEVRSAVMSLPKSYWGEGRHAWVKVAMALKSFDAAGHGDEAEEIWHAFSEQDTEQYGYDQAQRVFETANPQKITYLSIFRWARAAGWMASSMPSATKCHDARQTAYSAADLFVTDFPDVEYIVPELIVPGFTLLAGAPKLGKSWLALDIADGVAAGGMVLGRRCIQGDTLYCALEDNPRRLKGRLDMIHSPRFSSPSPRMTLWTDMPGIDDGGIDRLREWLVSVANPKLIIIDVLNKVRAAPKNNEALYSYDYRSVTPLKDLADEFGVAIVAIHHTRKQEADDPLEGVSGSNGLTGAADSIIVLNRKGTGGGPVLAGRGRDIAEFEFAVEFQKDFYRWSIRGEATEIRVSDQRGAILDVLADGDEAAGIREIVSGTGFKEPNVKTLLKKMVRDGEVVRSERGKYTLPSKLAVTTVTLVAETPLTVVP